MLIYSNHANASEMSIRLSMLYSFQGYEQSIIHIYVLY